MHARVVGLTGVSPVFRSNGQPCKGQTIFPSLILPRLSEAPRCGQELLMAQSSPPTLAMHIRLFTKRNSKASPTCGISDKAATLICSSPWRTGNGTSCNSCRIIWSALAASIPYLRYVYFGIYVHNSLFGTRRRHMQRGPDLLYQLSTPSGL